MKTSIASLLPVTAHELAQLGERLRLARLRRRMSADALAAAAGVSRVTLFRVEKGVPSVAMGAYARVLETLGLSGDLAVVAQEDFAGRQLQDQLLPPRRGAAPAGQMAVLREPSDDMWAFKRRNQRQDVRAIAEGRASNAAMSWFTEEQASTAQVVGEPL